MSTFGVEHHAMLFAWIAGEAVERFGQRGEDAILQGVRTYGEQRGRRMALRAQADGHTNDMVGYLIYGELDFGEAENEFVIVQKRPHLTVEARRCSWHATWSQRAVLAYGRLYCQEIDTAIMRGFNPGFDFEVAGTMSGGAPCCTFHYRSQGMGVWNTLRYAIGKKRVGSRATKPWDYHTGHIYKTFKETLSEALGEANEQAVDAAMQTFAREYGEDRAQHVRGFEDTDFDRVCFE